MKATLSISTQSASRWRTIVQRLVDLGGAKGVHVGILSGATNADGQSIAEYAAMNEFGGTITVPARQSEVYFKKKKDGTVGNRFVKKSKSNFAQPVIIPAHTVTIPSRPFMRTTAREKGKDWAQLFAQITKGRLVSDPAVAKRAFTAIGRVAKSDIQATIMSNMPPPNSPEYAASKKKKHGGYDGTLFLSGDMHKAVDFEVVDGSGVPVA